MSGTHFCHPLRRHGTTRLARLMEALKPEFFRLDERSQQDLITATYQYGQTLRYFNKDDQPQGYWDCFWEVETLTYLAVVAAKDTKELRRQYDVALRAVRAAQAAGSNTPQGPSPESYLPIVTLLFDLALSLEQTFQQLKRIGHPLQSLLLNRIRRDNDCDVEELEGALRQLIALHKAADQTLPQHWDKYSPFFAPSTGNSTGGSSGTGQKYSHWGVENRVDFDSIKRSTQINERLLRRLFLIFYDTWVIIKNAAQSGFDTELARMELTEDVEERKVQPHVALYLAFLHLFRHAQDSLNDLGKGHLDYYYEQVLGLRRRPENADDVWLLFELAQDVSEHLLEQGTLLPAGKDKNGQPLLYETIENWVLRRAQVADLKNTYFDKASGRILANPDVKKAYLNKTEKPNEKAAYWRAMGDDVQLPDGEVGFAIASPQLILREGKRVADVRIALKNSVDLTAIQAGYFKIYLSSKEKWIELDQNTAITETSIPDLPKGAFNIFFSNTSALNEMFIRVVLERDDLAVDTFGPEMAATAGFDTRWPIMKVAILPIAGGTQNSSIVAVKVYETLRQAEITEIKINVAVTGIKENLIIQSDQGVFDGTQKVFPFGPVPEEGNRFYIGSTEVFQKALTRLQVKFDWIAPSTEFSKHYREYNTVNFPVPNPKVRIEFVDRADDRKILISRVQRNGVLQKGSKVSLKITDVNFNPVEGVVLFSDPVGAILSSSGNGEYAVSLPAGFDPNAAASNIKLLFSKNLNEDYEPYEIYLRDTVSGSLAAPSAGFNIVLFPRQKKFDPYGGILSGLIKNIYGEDLPNAQINNKPSGFNNGKYQFAEAPIPAKLDFSNTNYETLSANPDGFSIIDAILYPSPNNDQTSGTFPTEFKGIVKNLKISPGGISGVRVVAKNGNTFLTATKTLNTGDYAFPKIDADRLEFYFEGQSTPQLLIKKPLPEVSLLQPQVVFTTQSEKITLSGTILGGASAVEMKINAGQPESVGGAFEKKDLNGNEVLTFSKTDHWDTVVQLERDKQIEVRIIDKTSDFVTTPNLAAEKVVQINFPNINIDLLEAFVVVVTDSDGKSVQGLNTTRSANRIEISNFLKPAKIILNGNINYPDIDFGVVDSKTVINVSYLAPFIVNQGSGDAGVVSGRIIDFSNQPVSDANIRLKNADFFFEVLSDNKGEFKIVLPSTSTLQNIPSAWKLLVSKGDFETRSIQNISTGQRIGVLLGHIKKTPATLYSAKGTVSSSWNLPKEIPFVKVTSGTIVTHTDENGEFSISNSNSPGITFSHPLYEALTIEMDGKSDMSITLLPKKSVLKVFEGNVSDVFGLLLKNVEIRATVGTDDFILAKSDKNGKYRVAIPDSVSEIRFVYQGSEFDPAVVTINTLSPQIQTGGSKSLMNVRMYYGKAINAPLIDNDKIEDAFDVKINALNLKRDIRTQYFEKYSPTLKRGFIRLTLDEGDFLHKEYPKVLLWHAVNAGKEGAVVIPPTSNNPIPPVPNEPYTPATNSISLDYSSEQIITGVDNIVGGDGSSIDQYFQLLPFNGHKGLDILGMKPEIVMLYPYKPQDASALGDKYATGNLFIGLSELEPGGTLSLLIQVAGGTETDPEKLPPDLAWSYLTFNNEWVCFNAGQILKDETRGLTRSGMIQFSIPTTVTNVNTMLDPKYYWLRVGALEDETKGKSVEALPSIVNIRAQTVKARFKNQENELSHLGKPLPAGTISGLLESRTAVKGVEQPLPSLGGRLPESEGMEFYQRVSERLRHRHRAVTVWDYEHLLLEQFTDLAAVKCIPHTRYKPAETASQLAPGYVTLAVIPALSLREDTWPEPRFPKGDLDEMRAFLLKRTNLFVAFEDKDDVHLQVVNPLYEKVDVVVEVKFRDGLDVSYYTEVLTQEIRQYISPWLKDTAKPPAFGRKLQRSRLLEFIEEREYVDYVGVERGDLKDTSIQYLGVFKAAVNVAGEPTGTVETIVEDICPGTARSILVAGSIQVKDTSSVHPDGVKKRSAQSRSAASAPPLPPETESTSAPSPQSKKTQAGAPGNRSKKTK